MNNNVENTIEKLRHYTKSYTDEIDKCSIPIKYDLVTEQQYTYVLHGIEYHNFDRHSTLILAKKLPFTYGYIGHNYEEPLINLINEDVIQPFIIFLNGKFIKWSDITIIRDCNFDYIKIEGTYTPEAKIDCILLPRDIKYQENVTRKNVSEDTYFVFTEDGRLDFSFNNPYTIIDVPNVYCESFMMSDGKRYKSSLKSDYLINDDSILVFTNNLYNNKAVTHNEGLNVISIDNKLDNILILFSNKTKNGEKDNLSVLPNKKYITDKLLEPPLTDNFKGIIERFDFSFTRDKLWEDNLLDSLKYIMNYNPNLMKDAYLPLCNIEYRYYTGQDLWNLADEKRYVRISRLINKSEHTQLIIFKNGLLYNGYHRMYIEKGRTFVIKLMDDVEMNDKFEFMFIKNTDNKEYPLYLYSLKQDSTYPLDPHFDLKHAKMFCKDHPDKKFSIKTSDNIQYEVGFTYEKKDNDEVMFSLKNSWYYDKDLSLVSGRDFRYYHTTAQDTSIGYLLPNNFKYANDLNRYMIFVNGRKIDKENYRITTIDPTRPFTNIAVYFKLILEKYDTVDIFYLPDIMEEVTVQPDVINNTIYLNTEAIKYGLDKDLYYIFLNGKKLVPDQIDNVSSTIIKLKNVNSTENLTIVKFVPDIDILAEMFNDSDIMSTFINNIRTSQFDKAFNNTMTYNEDPGLQRVGLSTRGVIYQIIKDFYDKPYINTSDLFLYNYEDDPDLIKDKDGNIIFNLADE